MFSPVVRGKINLAICVTLPKARTKVLKYSYEYYLHANSTNTLKYRYEKLRYKDVQVQCNEDIITNSFRCKKNVLRVFFNPL